jgi:hypothetical protein
MRSAYPAVFLCALACASAPSSSRLSTTGTAPSPVMLASTSNSNVTRGVLLTGSFTTEYFGGETLYDVLRRRAPQYLRPRPTPGAELTGQNDPLAIYIDGNFAGSADVLQLIPAYTVFSVDRISASEAAMKFGPKHSNGALLVHLVVR